MSLLPVPQNLQFDTLTLAVLISASSFGTILGIGLIYWLLQLDLPAKLQSAIFTVLLVIIGIYLFRINDPKNQIKNFQSIQNDDDYDNFKKKQLEIGKLISSPSDGTPKLHLLESKFLQSAKDDKEICDPFTRAVQERIRIMGIKQINAEESPEEFYKAVYGRCCESVIGSISIPVGVVGPIPLIGGLAARNIYVPLATVEGALVASVNRGCKALRRAYEKKELNLSCLVSQGPRKGMTRGPCFRASSIEKAADFLKALHDPERFKEWKKIFDSSSPGGHVCLLEIHGRQIGNLVYVRVRSDTSEAMGMNMISRGCSNLFEQILNLAEFEGIKMESLSGNYCVDKKPAAINWIQGRGREVIVSARIPAEILKEVFGTDDIEALEKLNLSKNLIGSAAAGSIGGFNAHVANVVAAIYLSTGQDVAQVVDASQAMTLLEFDRIENELVAMLTMPCIEIGIRGGGTGLPHQNKCLQMIIGDSTEENGNKVVDEFARCVGLVALAGELSLLASLQAGTLVSSHFKFNH